MKIAPQKLWLASKLILTIVLILAAFAVIIPNCIIPASAVAPTRFAWAGLLTSFVISSVLVYGIWYWK
jgi:hypothetical protein